MIARKVLAEALGALLLTACVIGSGVMAERLAGGNAAVGFIAAPVVGALVGAQLLRLFAERKAVA